MLKIIGKYQSYIVLQNIVAIGHLRLIKLSNLYSQINI